jgi:cytochrome c biogenesis protein CcmG, thiol:disulfide interchange protein DsbE
MQPATDSEQVRSGPAVAVSPERRGLSSVSAFIAEPRRWFAFTVLVLVAGVAWTLRSTVPPGGTTQGPAPSPREGFAAPDFTLDLLGGGHVTLSELRGKAVVVNLWASWCPPCRAEMPALQRVYEANRDRGLEIVALNTTFQDSEAAAAEFVREFGLTFPVALDRNGEASRAYQLRALPTTFFIDRNGVIRGLVIGGPMSETTVQTTVEELLAGE